MYIAAGSARRSFRNSRFLVDATSDGNCKFSDSYFSAKELTETPDWSSSSTRVQEARWEGRTPRLHPPTHPGSLWWLLDEIFNEPEARRHCFPGVAPCRVFVCIFVYVYKSPGPSRQGVRPSRLPPFRQSTARRIHYFPPFPTITISLARYRAKRKRRMRRR